MTVTGRTDLPCKLLPRAGIPEVFQITFSVCQRNSPIPEYVNCLPIKDYRTLFESNDLIDIFTIY